MRDFKKEYTKFNIPKEKMPKYDGDLYEYASQFNKCAIYEYEDINYSCTTTSVVNEPDDQK
jgi:hypothetical protein